MEYQLVESMAYYSLISFKSQLIFRNIGFIFGVALRNILGNIMEYHNPLLEHVGTLHFPTIVLCYLDWVVVFTMTTPPNLCGFCECVPRLILTVAWFFCSEKFHVYRWVGDTKRNVFPTLSKLRVPPKMETLVSVSIEFC